MDPITEQAISSAFTLLGSKILGDILGGKQVNPYMGVSSMAGDWYLRQLQRQARGAEARMRSAYASRGLGASGALLAGLSRIQKATMERYADFLDKLAMQKAMDYINWLKRKYVEEQQRRQSWGSALGRLAGYFLSSTLLPKTQQEKTISIGEYQIPSAELQRFYTILALMSSPYLSSDIKTKVLQPLLEKYRVPVERASQQTLDALMQYYTGISPMQGGE